MYRLPFAGNFKFIGPDVSVGKSGLPENRSKSFCFFFLLEWKPLRIGNVQVMVVHHFAEFG